MPASKVSKRFKVGLGSNLASAAAAAAVSFDAVDATPFSLAALSASAETEEEAAAAVPSPDSGAAAVAASLVSGLDADAPSSGTAGGKVAVSSVADMFTNKS